MAVEVERYIVELGTEGRLIEMQLEETMVGVAADKTALIRDYSVEDTEENLATTLSQIARLPIRTCSTSAPGRAARLRAQGLDTRLPGITARLSRARPHPAAAQLVVQRIIHEFGGLEEILAASDDDLEAVEGVGDVAGQGHPRGHPQASRDRSERPLLTELMASHRRPEQGKTNS